MNASSKTIVCYGDSNTHGYNSSNMGRFTEKERFPCLLAELLGPGWLVREEGLFDIILLYLISNYKNSRRKLIRGAQASKNILRHPHTLLRLSSNLYISF